VKIRYVAKLFLNCSSSRLWEVVEQQCCWWWWAAANDGQLGGVSDHQCQLSVTLY